MTVLEADGAPVPDDPAQAWDRWARRGVAQFHQPHNLFARARQIMDDDLPGLTDRLVDAGGTWIDPTASLPPTITDRSPFPDDARFRFVNARRPTVEAVFARAADEHDGVDVRRGVIVTGLRADTTTGGAPRVTGVHVKDERDVEADLVVDAMGRRTKLPEWLQTEGAATPYVESEDSGFVYYTRYFRGPEYPVAMAPPLSMMGSVSLLTLRSDNNTWSVTVFGASADTDLRPLRDPDCFERVVRACPLHAQWLEGERITGIEVMGGILDKYRRYVVDDRPVVTGMIPVGDAWACTNPSAGRGISIGLIHAQRLRDVVREGLEDADSLVRRFDEVTETHVTPFYRNQIAADRVRVAEMDAIRHGSAPPEPDPMMASIAAAMGRDGVVFRGMIETLTCLALPQEVFARPEFKEHVAPYAGQVPRPLPTPTRAELLELLH